jgi:hypothetical protein
VWVESDSACVEHVGQLVLSNEKRTRSIDGGCENICVAGRSFWFFSLDGAESVSHVKCLDRKSALVFSGDVAPRARVDAAVGVVWVKRDLGHGLVEDGDGRVSIRAAEECAVQPERTATQ